MKHFFYLLLLISLIRCGNEQSDGLLSRSDVRNIKKEFSKEAIRYFYETALHSELNMEAQRADDSVTVRRWISDINIKLSGNFESMDSIIAHRVIDSINNIGLPINLSILPPDDDNFNLEIFLLPLSELPLVRSRGKSLGENIDARGMLYLTSTPPCIDFGLIGIPSYYEYDMRERVLLHELTNALGLFFDPLTSSNSILFVGVKIQPCLSQLDKETLHLLYSPYMKDGLTRSEFKSKFKEYVKDEHIVSEEDYDLFEKFIKKEKFSDESVGLFIDGAFFDIEPLVDTPQILKIHPESYIGFSTKETRERYVFFMKEIIQALEKYLPKEYKLSIGNENMGYNIEIESGDTIMYGLMAAYKADIRTVPYHQIFLSKIQLNNIISDATDETKLHIMAQALFYSLGVHGGIKCSDYINHSEIFNDQCSGLGFSKTDEEFVKLFFSPYVKNGMTKERIVAILNKYYDLSRLTDVSYSELEEYISSTNLSLPAINIIYTAILNIEEDPILKKWNRELNVIIADDYYESDSIFIKNLASYFDKNKLFMPIRILEKPYELTPNAIFKFNDSEKYFVNTSMVPYNNSIAHISVSYIFDTQDILKRNKLILYGILTYLYLDIKNSELLLKNSVDFYNERYVQLKSEWEEALHFYYHPALKAGMEKQKVMAIFEKYYGKL